MCDDEDSDDDWEVQRVDTDDYPEDSVARQFITDMQAAGLTVEHYHGRCAYEGPAVRTDTIQDAVMHTKVPCRHDSMGRGVIVHTSVTCYRVAPV